MIAVEVKLSAYTSAGKLVEAIVITAITENQRDRILDILSEPNGALQQKPSEAA